MIEFIRLAPQSQFKPTDRQCEEVKDKFVESDERSELPLFTGLHFQSVSHQCLDSNIVDGRAFNRYNFLDDGEGIYPARRDDPIYTKDGYFALHNGNLPTFETDQGTKEVAADRHRVNENPAMKAMHLLWCKAHNKFMDLGYSFEESKDMTVALHNQVTINETIRQTDLTETQILRNIEQPNMHKSLEHNFGVGRHPHAMMPDTLNDLPIFEKRPSSEVDLVSTFTKEKSRVINLGVSKAMNNMTHLSSMPFDIKERTFGRHLELNICTWGELIRLWPIALREAKDTQRFDNEIIPDYCPAWAGILLEAEEFGDGLLGPIGSRMFADATAGQLKWAEDKAKGLWHKMFKGAPKDTLEILEWING